MNPCVADLTDLQLSQLISSLPSWRREVVLRIRHQQGRRESALAYAELCRGLQQEYGIAVQPHFQENEHGKPTLPAYPHIHFSLSHCACAVGCLLSSVPCGLDIERIRQPRPALVRYTMNEQEQQHIFSSPHPDVAFTLLWTRKEAILKLLGTGIAGADLKGILTSPAMQHVHLRSTDCSPQGYVYTEAWQAEPHIHIKDYILE